MRSRRPFFAVDLLVAMDRAIPWAERAACRGSGLRFVTDPLNPRIEERFEEIVDNA